MRAGLIGWCIDDWSAFGMPVLAQTRHIRQRPQRDQAIDEIVVTAQRTAQSLQDVPIAVSAFSAEALQRQQIQNSSDLQLTLPNIVFTKGNFTGSSFTIRGIGDLCVGVTCDSATAIHVNGSPLVATRLFEAEFFDMERIEVLRGPQGTLFGRNATSGVINFVTAKPNLTAIGAAGEVDYGNLQLAAPARAWSTCRSPKPSACASPVSTSSATATPTICSTTPDRWPRHVRHPRLGAVGTHRQHPHRPDGLLFQGGRQPFAHPEAALPARSDRRARLPSRPAR